MTEQDQNRKINELRRLIQQNREDINTALRDVEPGGHISQGFERLERDIDSLHRRFDVLSSQVNRVLARQEVMLQALTKIDDLPEE